MCNLWGCSLPLPDYMSNIRMNMEYYDECPEYEYH